MDKPVVAAFDFDGTMTRGDTLFPFLLFAAGPARFFRLFFLLLPTLLGYKLGIIKNNVAKEIVFTRFFAGTSIDSIQKIAYQFSTQKLPELIKPDAMSRFKWHKQQGHRCVLISASLDIYLQAWASSIGFDDVISSSLETTKDGCVTGKLAGANCFGAEKARRLYALMGDRSGYELYAYGDSTGDKELLSMADYAYYREMPAQ